MENRLESLRKLLDNLVYKNEPDQAVAYASHMYGVSKFCSLLAKKRGLNSEIAAICGMLHDIGYMEVDANGENHAEIGAKRARTILSELGRCSGDEIEIIVLAIERHSEKLKVHGEYDELLKDADVMDHSFYNTALPIRDCEVERFNRLLEELGTIPN